MVTMPELGVPRQFQIHNVGGCGTTVGDVDARQHHNDTEKDGDNARRRGRPVVDEAGEGGLADAFVLHLVEQFVVRAVGAGFFFVACIGPVVPDFASSQVA